MHFTKAIAAAMMALTCSVTAAPMPESTYSRNHNYTKEVAAQAVHLIHRFHLKTTEVVDTIVKMDARYEESHHHHKSNATAGNFAAKSSAEKRDGRDHWGKATMYWQNNNAGSCGVYNPDSALIVALSADRWMPHYKSDNCGRRIKVTNIGSDSGAGGLGNTIVATVADTCPATECDSGHVDFSQGAWNALTSNSPPGTAQIQWHFCDTDC